MAQPLDAARASHLLSSSSEPAWQIVQLPRPILRDLERHAERLGQSMSWCLRMAWSLAGDLEVPPTAPKRLRGGRHQAVRVVLPMATWRAIAATAESLDRSRSWLLARAWLASRGRVGRTPAWAASA